MSPLLIDIAKVGLIAAIYLFLWFVARAIGRHLSSKETAPPAATPRTPTSPDAIVVTLTERDRDSPRHIEVRRPLVVGRGPVDVVIDDPFASDRHLLLRADDGRLVVEDLGSTNGTVVNDVVIHGPTVVGPGDRIVVGTTTLEVR